MKLGKMVPVVVKINRPADQLAPRALGNESREIHSVVEKTGFIAGFLEQNATIGGCVPSNPIYDGGNLRANRRAELELPAAFGLQQIE